MKNLKMELHHNIISRKSIAWMLKVNQFKYWGILNNHFKKDAVKIGRILWKT